MYDYSFFLWNTKDVLQNYFFIYDKSRQNLGLSSFKENKTPPCNIAGVRNRLKSCFSLKILPSIVFKTIVSREMHEPMKCAVSSLSISVQFQSVHTNRLFNLTCSHIDYFMLFCGVLFFLSFMESPSTFIVWKRR